VPELLVDDVAVPVVDGLGAGVRVLGGELDGHATGLARQLGRGLEQLVDDPAAACRSIDVEVVEDPDRRQRGRGERRVHLHESDGPSVVAGEQQHRLTALEALGEERRRRPDVVRPTVELPVCGEEGSGHVDVLDARPADVHDPSLPRLWDVWLSFAHTPADLHVRRIFRMFSVLLALAFSLAVCAVIGVGVTTGFDRLLGYVKDVRERAARRRSTQES
jgi:hypothetical protein